MPCESVLFSYLIERHDVQRCGEFLLPVAKMKEPRVKI